MVARVDVEALVARSLADCVATYAALVAPPPPVTVAEWADANRVMAPPSPWPGPWRTDRMPYLREVMERLSPSDPCESVAMMKCVQTGGTEVALNFLGHCVDTDPSSFLYVMPTVEDARRTSRLRVAKMLADCPTLASKIAPAKSRDSTNSTLEKHFPGGFFRMAGANAASGLQSDSIKRLVCDEIDQWPLDVDGQGDPVGMAVGRTTAYERSRKVFLLSKATVKATSRILKAFDEGDQRHYYVPCPECGVHQHLRWEQVRWPSGRPDQAYYVCEAHGCVIESWRKDEMLTGGEWRPHAAFNGRHHSYHINSLYAPSGSISWASLAVEYCAAQGDPVRLKKFVTERLGLPWEDDWEHGRDHEQFVDRLEDYGPTAQFPTRPHCPAGVVLLTAGVDVQGDRLEYEIRGWGLELESWMVDHGVVFGDTSDAASDAWRDLDVVLRRVWRHEQLAAGLRVAATAVDSGYNTDAVYAFCERRMHRRVWAIKGQADERKPIWPERPSQPRGTKGASRRTRVYPVGQFQAKEHLFARLRRTDPGPGYMHFNRSCDETYFKQLLSERLVEEIHDGRRVRLWKTVGTRRNEALDRVVYAYAALHGLAQARGMTPEQAIAHTAEAIEQTRSAKPAPRARPAARVEAAPQNDWLAGIGDWWG